MSSKIYKLLDGVEGLFVRNDRFNTTSISFNFYLPLKPDTVASYALLPFILTTCGKKYPDFSALNYKLNRLYGAQLDASAEKLADFQLLRIRISVINDNYTIDSESLIKDASELLLSLIFDPNASDGKFNSNDLSREKRKAIEHVKSELTEKRIYAKNRLISEMYKGTAYGIPKCGTVEDIEKINETSLYNSWIECLKTAYVRIQVIGTAIPARLFEDISERFRTITRENITSFENIESTKPISSPKLITERMEIQQGKLVLGFTSDLAGGDDISLPLLVMTDIFGGGPYSRLFSNVREKMSLCYYCSASSVRQKGLLTVESGVESENAEKTQDEILNQLDVMKKGNFTDFEFESSIKSIRDSLKTYNDSQVSLDTWYALKALEPIANPPEFIASEISKITKQEVTAIANGINLHTVYVLLPKEEA